MHVLSTPPAFILSQDQTLKLKFVSLSHFTDSFFASLFTLVILLILSDNWIDLGFGFFQLFSFQGSMSFLFRFPLSPSAFNILPQLSMSVKNFFIYFFKLFSIHLLCCFVLPCFPVNKIVLYSFHRKSQHFFKTFFDFFQLSFFMAYLDKISVNNPYIVLINLCFIFQLLKYVSRWL